MWGGRWLAYRWNCREVPPDRHVLRLQRLGGRWWSVLLALAACGVACVYAATLNATADVAGVLGLSWAAPCRGSHRHGLAVAWARADAWQLGWAVLGAVAAGAFSCADLGPAGAERPGSAAPYPDRPPHLGARRRTRCPLEFGDQPTRRFLAVGMGSGRRLSA